MKSKTEKLSEILKTDQFGLLKKAPPKSIQHKKSILELDFEQIIKFYERTGRLPSDTGSLLEKKLAYRLEALRKSLDACNKLEAIDYPGLLLNQKDEVLGIIDPAGLLSSNAEVNSITTLKHITSSDRINPDYMAQRTQCLDFEAKYKSSFEAVSNEISEGKRYLTTFNPPDLEAGKYYVLHGILLFLESDDSDSKPFSFNSGNKVRRDGRTRCIFNNGKESNLLYRSLIKALEKDGYSVSETIPGTSTAATVTAEDKAKGYIYVLKTRSKDPKIRNIPDLYKIGFSSGNVTDRIKNATNEPTYLMSDVIIVEQVKCYNMSIRGLEDTIHKIFGTANVKLSVMDKNGTIHQPKEWFSVPLAVIEQAINLIVAGKANDIKYDSNLKTLIHTINK